MTMIILIILMKEMPNSTASWRDSMENIREKQNSISKEEQQFKFKLYTYFTEIKQPEFE